MADAIEPAQLQARNAGSRCFSSAHFAGSFERYGFAVVGDHELPQSSIDGCLDRFKAFFGQDAAFKERYRVPGIGGARGYTPLGRRDRKGAAHHDLKEFWQIGRELPPGHRYRSSMPDNVWIEGDRNSGRASLELWDAFDRMGRKLLEAISTYLRPRTALVRRQGRRGQQRAARDPLPASREEARRAYAPARTRTST